jgi:adenine-specific DNA-methyltransferase
MDKLKMTSMDKVQENIQKIRDLFPNAVTEVLRDGEPTLAVDFDILKQEMSNVLIDDKEQRYQFTWPDKNKSILLANTPISATLRPCKEESVDFDNTQNLYIEGDNLEVLKLLQETYLGKIKMIYIDPPYNTGNDFVYNDDFAQDSEEYLDNSGQYDEVGNRLFQNTESNGRFHTDWLNMIYPRLCLAKDLLSDDGVIFISIDDNEARNLKILCDEVFGELNFIGQIVWQTTQKNDPRFIAINHEYILCYVKNIMVQNEKGKWRVSHPLIREMMDEYEAISKTNTKIEDIQVRWNSVIKKEKYSALKHYKFVDKRGPYFAADISDPQRKGPKHDFVIHPITKQLCKAPSGGYSPREAEMRRRLENDEIHFGPTHEYVVCSKKYLVTAEDRLNSVYYEDGRRATKVLEDLIGKGVFEHPKSEILIKRLLGFVTQKESVVLDFFSGSATTAHAVMQLNVEDGGSRKFIMVQLPELCDEKSEAYKAGYKNICEIGKERIRRAGKKIKEEKGQFAQNLDIGFRVLKLDSSNMKDVYYRPEDYSQSLLDMFEDNIKEDRTPLDLLFQVMLDLGKPLSAKIVEKEIAGKHVFIVDDNDLIACFDKEITDEVVKTIAQMKPLYAVFRDSSMANDSVGTNFEQIFATYSPNTTRKVL